MAASARPALAAELVVATADAPPPPLTPGDDRERPRTARVVAAATAGMARARASCASTRELGDLRAAALTPPASRGGTRVAPTLPPPPPPEDIRQCTPPATPPPTPPRRPQLPQLPVGSMTPRTHSVSPRLAVADGTPRSARTPLAHAGTVSFCRLPLRPTEAGAAPSPPSSEWMLPGPPSETTTPRLRAAIGEADLATAAATPVTIAAQPGVAAAVASRAEHTLVTPAPLSPLDGVGEKPSQTLFESTSKVSSACSPAQACADMASSAQVLPQGVGSPLRAGTSAESQGIIPTRRTYSQFTARDGAAGPSSKASPLAQQGSGVASTAASSEVVDLPLQRPAETDVPRRPEGSRFASSTLPFESALLRSPTKEDSLQALSPGQLALAPPVKVPKIHLENVQEKSRRSRSIPCANIAGLAAAANQAFAAVLGGRQHLKTVDIQKICERFRELRAGFESGLFDKSLSQDELSHVLGFDSASGHTAGAAPMIIAPLFDLLSQGEGYDDQGHDGQRRCDFRVLLVALAGLTRAPVVERMRFAALLLDEEENKRLTQDQLELLLRANSILTSFGPPPSQEALRHSARLLIDSAQAQMDQSARQASISIEDFLNIARGPPEMLKLPPDQPMSRPVTASTHEGQPVSRPVTESTLSHLHTPSLTVEQATLSSGSSFLVSSVAACAYDAAPPQPKPAKRCDSGSPEGRPREVMPKILPPLEQDGDMGRRRRSPSNKAGKRRKKEQGEQGKCSIAVPEAPPNRAVALRPNVPPLDLEAPKPPEQLHAVLRDGPRSPSLVRHHGAIEGAASPVGSPTTLNMFVAARGHPEVDELKKRKAACAVRRLMVAASTFLVVGIGTLTLELVGEGARILGVGGVLMALFVVGGGIAAVCYIIFLRRDSREDSVVSNEVQEVIAEEGGSTTTRLRSPTAKGKDP